MSFREPLELQSLLSGNDALKLLELIQRSIRCDEQDDFRILFQRIGELFPFDFAVAILGHRENNGFIASGGVDIGLADDFSREYSSRDYLQKDLLIKESLESRALQCWPDDWQRLGQKKEIISLCLDYNMPEGYIHGAGPALSAKNESIFCFSGVSLEHGVRNTAIMELLIPHLHMALCHTVNNGRADDGTVILSNREREVLNWLKEGKSSWDISVILGISESTVNFHIYNIMQKLGTTNRPQTIAVAARLGQIDLG
jgi:DNA-binding CsgD family transcriptional regulator